MSEKRFSLPRYNELPIDASKPPRSAWGVFGDDDEVGTINLLTPELVQRAVAHVHKGAVFSLNWDLEKPNPPLLNRKPLQHTIVDLNPGTDDYYDHFYTQMSSQWDALNHMPNPEYGYYNGRTRADFTGKPGSRNGIDHWARRGIVGRFVLADIARYRQEQGRPIQYRQTEEITVDEIDATLARQGVALEEGDILLLRFGWIGWYEQTDEQTRLSMVSEGIQLKTPGLARREHTLEWLWDHHLSAVAADNPALEAHPPQPWDTEHYLHYRLIPFLGMAVGELFVLDALAADCASDGVYTGLLTAAPLNKLGGSGSTANALALK